MLGPKSSYLRFLSSLSHSTFNPASAAFRAECEYFSPHSLHCHHPSASCGLLLLAWIPVVALSFHTYHHPHISHTQSLHPTLHCGLLKTDSCLESSMASQLTTKSLVSPVVGLPGRLLLHLWIHLLLCHSIIPLQTQWSCCLLHEHTKLSATLGPCPFPVTMLFPQMCVWLAYSFDTGLSSSIILRTRPSPIASL